jgi:quercetin dioxygenase-like cupin family protein
MKIHSDYREVKASEEVPGVDMRVVIGPNEEAPNFVMRVFEVEPGASTPFHSHPWEHEVYVFGGAGRVRSDAGETELSAGSVVYVAPDEQHCFSNAGDDLLRFVCVIPKPDQ